METKICRLCNKEKPLTLVFFHKDNNAKDKFTNRCKLCRNNLHRLMRKEKEFVKKEREYSVKRRKSPIVKELELKQYKKWIKNNKEYLRSINYYHPKYKKLDRTHYITNWDKDQREKELQYFKNNIL